MKKGYRTSFAWWEMGLFFLTVNFTTNILTFLICLDYFFGVPIHSYCLQLTEHKLNNILLNVLFFILLPIMLANYLLFFRIGKKKADNLIRGNKSKISHVPFMIHFFSGLMLFIAILVGISLYRNAVGLT